MPAINEAEIIFDQKAIKGKLIEIVALLEDSRALAKRTIGKMLELEALLEGAKSKRALAFMMIDQLTVKAFYDEVEEMLENFQMLRDGIEA